MIDAPVASASAMTSSPPTTRLSLLASARSMPSPSDATVGPSPAEPTSAFSTRSAPLSVTSFTSPSGPLSTSPSVQRSAARAAARSSARPIRLTPNWAACSSSSVSLDPAASATTSRSRERETTSRAWVPIDPVDPAMTMRRTQASLGAPDLRRLRALHAHHVQVLVTASQRRLTGGPEPAGVHLLVQHAGLERGPLVRDHPSAPDRDDLEVVVGMAFVVLLPVAPAHARASGHEDPGARTVPSGLPRSLAGGHAAVRVELLRVLAEVPDVAGTVLRVPVERVLHDAVVLEHPVVHDAGAAAGYGAGLVRHDEDVLRRRAFVGARIPNDGSGLQREPPVVDAGGDRCRASRCGDYGRCDEGEHRYTGVSPIGSVSRSLNTTSRSSSSSISSAKPRAICSCSRARTACPAIA